MPAAPRGVYSFDDRTIACPEEAVLDTSFVVETLLPGQPLHNACREYVGRLFAAKTQIYFNGLLELELCEAACRLALKERFGRSGPTRYRRDGRARRRAGRIMEATRSGWQLTLLLFDYVRIEPLEVESLVPELMRKYGLGSYDAVHAATAIYVAVPHIVTADAGFAAELSLFTNTGRLAACRRVRSRGSVTR